METSRASGKGWTPGQARDSCLGEAAERYSGMFRGDEPRLLACRLDLPGRSVDPQDLLQYSPRQYEDRNVWNAAFGACQYIPEPCGPEEPLEWTATRSLLDGSTVWVPTGACYFRYAPPVPKIVFPNETTGFAAAPTLDDAIVRAFLELVERDALALWWYNRCIRPAVDLPADDGHLAAVRHYLAAHGRSLHFLDLTTDFAIPAVAAVSATEQGDAVLFGFAAEFDPAEALRRAAAELVQILGPPRFWSKQAMLEHYDLRIDRKAWLTGGSTPTHPYLLPSGAPACIPSLEPADRLEACRQIARSLNLEPLTLDLTRAEIGVPVARVLVPGLRSSWRHLGPGRLYDTPVRLGWLNDVTPESRMNSYPFFL
jgi:ribosomal protein S12 methylthiotransferase accessory factor